MEDIVHLRIPTTWSEPYDIAIIVSIALREIIAAVDGDCALDTVIAVKEDFGCSRYIVAVHFEEMARCVEIEACGAGMIAVSGVVVFAEDDTEKDIRAKTYI